jgi:hypothetical protein
LEKIFWDLDGVLRDLIAVVGHDPQSYHEKIDGLTFVEYVSQNKELLVKAPVTEYFSVAKSDEQMVVITCQPLDWIPYTTLWLRKHLPDVGVIYVQNPLDKLDIIKRVDALLVEDYPDFPDNSRIVMIDRPYNQNATDCYDRIYTPAELNYFLYSMGH